MQDHFREVQSIFIDERIRVVATKLLVCPKKVFFFALFHLWENPIGFQIFLFLNVLHPDDFKNISVCDWKHS